MWIAVSARNSGVTAFAVKTAQLAVNTVRESSARLYTGNDPLMMMSMK